METRTNADVAAINYQSREKESLKMMGYKPRKRFNLIYSLHPSNASYISYIFTIHDLFSGFNLNVLFICRLFIHSIEKGHLNQKRKKIHVCFIYLFLIRRDTGKIDKCSFSYSLCIMRCKGAMRC